MSKKILLGILLFFLFTRISFIDSIPTSLYWDEVSIGYNAYSLTVDGKDEWGESYPLHFKAFGEYKLPVYIYSVALVTKIIGPGILAVRLPSVIYSLITVMAIYLLTKKLTNSGSTSLMAAFFLVVTPWFFIFSRTGFEATAGLAFYLMGIYFLIGNLKIKTIFISAIFFLLSLYSYNSFRIVTPLSIMAILFFTFVHQGLKSIIVKYYGLFLILFLIGCFPIIIFLSLGSSISRFEQTSLLYGNSSFTQLVFEIAKNYTSNLNPIYLFFVGDSNLRHSIGGFGELFTIFLPLLILGFFWIFTRQRTLIILFILLLIGIIPSSITKESPHSLRTLSALPFFIIIAALGSNYMTTYFKKLKFKIYLPILVGLCFGIFYFSFLTSYNQKSASDWQYGYYKVIGKYKEQMNKYDNIIITDKYYHPYIFMLYYLHYLPEKFRKEVVINKNEIRVTSLVEKYGNISFKNVDFYNFPEGKNLIFAHPLEKLSEIKEKEIIFYPNLTPAIYVYEFTK